MTEKKDERKYYIDILRIMSCIAVVFIHVSASLWYKVDVNSYDFTITAIYDCLARYAVPVFFMITGALMLKTDKVYDIKRLYLHNIKKLIILFFFWVIVSSAFDFYRSGNSFQGFQSIIDIIKSIVSNQYQLWFMCPLISIYICLPFLKKICEDKKILKYFLLLFFIFFFIRNTCYLFLDDIKMRFFGLFSSGMIVGYQGYALLGYYLDNEDFSKKKRIIIYILGVVSLLINIILTIVLSKSNNEGYDKLLSNEILTVGLFAISVFVLIKTIYKDKKFGPKTIKIISALSDCTIGIYVLHEFAISFTGSILKIKANFINPLFGIPVECFIVLAICLIITAILKMIPLVKKYLI